MGANPIQTYMTNPIVPYGDSKARVDHTVRICLNNIIISITNIKTKMYVELPSSQGKMRNVTGSDKDQRSERLA